MIKKHRTVSVVPLRTLRIDINPLRDFRYVVATRYATLDMFASQTRDLYRIELI